MIGHWGKYLVFSVSDKKILTFHNFSQTLQGRWETHNIIGKKPRLEFQGADLREIEMEIRLDAAYGVKPRKLLEKIEQAVQSGRAEKLVIGGKAIGKNRFVIKSVSETWNCIFNRGELVIANVTLSLTEYR